MPPLSAAALTLYRRNRFFYVQLLQDDGMLSWGDFLPSDHVMGGSCVMVWLALQVVKVREEAVTELSKHIKEAQSLQDLRQADAVGPPIASPIARWLLHASKLRLNR